MRDVAEIVVPWALVTLALFVLLDRDEARLPLRDLDRAWPPATRALALVYFGILAVPVHFWRTRRTVRGTLLGLAWAAVASAFSWGASEGLDALPDAAMPGLLAFVVLAVAAAFLYRAKARERFEKGRRSRGAAGEGAKVPAI